MIEMRHLLAEDGGGRGTVAGPTAASVPCAAGGAAGAAGARGGSHHEAFGRDPVERLRTAGRGRRDAEGAVWGISTGIAGRLAADAGLGASAGAGGKPAAGAASPPLHGAPAAQGLGVYCQWRPQVPGQHTGGGGSGAEAAAARVRGARPGCGPVAANPGLTASRSEVHRLVYQEIERSARRGIWTRDLKRATSLQQVSSACRPLWATARRPRPGPACVDRQE